MQSKLNLASQVYVNKRALYLGYAVVTAVLILVLATQLRYLSRLQQQEQFLNQRIAEIQTQLGLTAESASYTPDELNKLLQNIEFSNNLIVKDSFQWTGLLSKLEAVVPDRVRIIDLRPNFKDSVLTISAQAESLQQMNEFIDALNASPDFSEILLLSQNELELPEPKNGLNKLIVFNLKAKGELQ